MNMILLYAYINVLTALPLEDAQGLMSWAIRPQKLPPLKK